MKRIAVVGAGMMARVRTQALLATSGATVCGVAARHSERAAAFAADLHLDDCACLDDYRQLARLNPDAVLVEVPHEPQHEIVKWAMLSGFHVLIGGALASTVDEAAEIQRLATKRQLIVEAGYEARYSALWEAARHAVTNGHLGRPIAVRSIALWAGDPESWYYNQHASGGMPLTHMTYCFINPVRWLLGRPLAVSAFCNRKRETSPAMISEETCVTNILFNDNVLYSATAGFVRPGSLPAWSVTVIGTEAALDLHPAENGIGTMVFYSPEKVETIDFNSSPDPFEMQAANFLQAIGGKATCLNPPDDAMWDVRVAEAIVTSAREIVTVTLPQ